MGAGCGAAALRAGARFGAPCRVFIAASAFMVCTARNAGPGVSVISRRTGPAGAGAAGRAFTPGSGAGLRGPSRPRRGLGGKKSRRYLGASRVCGASRRSGRSRAGRRTGRGVARRELAQLGARGVQGLLGEQGLRGLDLVLRVGGGLGAGDREGGFGLDEPGGQIVSVEPLLLEQVLFPGVLRIEKIAATAADRINWAGGGALGADFLEDAHRVSRFGTIGAPKNYGRRPAGRQGCGRPPRGPDERRGAEK